MNFETIIALAMIPVLWTIFKFWRDGEKEEKKLDEELLELDKNINELAEATRKMGV